MTTWTAHPLSVTTDVLQIARLYRLCHRHHSVRVLSTAPVAWVGRERVEAHDLRELLDILEQRFRPDG